MNNKKMEVWGILNVTPDSFSDGGKFFDPSVACEHALAMKADGADVIDIGGMSTRPGFEDVPEEEEIRRVVPVIKAIKEKDPSCVISVDTFRAGTAEASLTSEEEERSSCRRYITWQHRLQLLLQHQGSSSEVIP